MLALCPFYLTFAISPLSHSCIPFPSLPLPSPFPISSPGSQVVARSILLAAAPHLTPVTLELGGKSPCFIYGHIDIQKAAKRLCWSKFFNTGQSCVAPDYVLCTAQTRDALLPALRETLRTFYGPDPGASLDMGRIVTPRHWRRLMDMLEKSKGKVVIGGESREEDRYIGEFGGVHERMMR